MARTKAAESRVAGSEQVDAAVAELGPHPAGVQVLAGAGFTEAMLHDLAVDLDPLATPSNPFIAVPRPDARWVTPRLVGEVAFTEWTDEGRLRHPAWRGLRPYKSSDQVVRES